MRSNVLHGLAKLRHVDVSVICSDLAGPCWQGSLAGLHLALQHSTSGYLLGLPLADTCVEAAVKCRSGQTDIRHHRICKAFRPTLVLCRGFILRPIIQPATACYRRQSQHANICCRQSSCLETAISCPAKASLACRRTPGLASMQLHQQGAVCAHGPSW